MDTSKEYILMCEKATEIQKTMCILPAEDPYEYDETNHILCAGDCFYTISIKSIIWLPRQDQLQEMIIEETTSTFALCERFWKFVANNWHNIWSISSQHPSLEQLWLSFVMDKKYSKHWDGKEWEVV